MFRTRHRPSIASALFLAALFLVIYGRYLAGHAPSGGDIVNQYLPYQELVRNAVRGGELPLWNSFTFLGRPLMADIQVGVLYPPNWLHWFLPLPVSFALVLALHGALMLLGCWFLGRKWGLRPEAIALGAALYGAGPFFTLKGGQGIVLFIYVGAWWPWLALAMTRLIEKPGFGPMLLLMATLAMSLLAGSPQITFYTWLGVLALGVALPKLESNPIPALRAENDYFSRIGWITAAFVCALGLTAIQTFQTWFFIQSSFERAAGAGWDYITASSLEPRLLWLLVNPGFLGVGAPDAGAYWGGTSDFAESCFYSPLWTLLVLLPLAIAGWVAQPASIPPLHRRLAGLGAAAMLIGLLLALGHNSYFFRFFYEFFPAFNKFRVPLRLMLFWSAGQALLAALALDALLKIEKPRRALPLTAIAATIFALAVVALTYVFRIPLWRMLGNTLLETPQAVAIYNAHAAKLALIIGAGIVCAGACLIAIARLSRFRPLLALALSVVAAAELLFLAWPFQATTPWDEYNARFYPQTPIVEKLRREHRGGAVLWMDDSLSYLHDQNQPEILTNRLVMQGLPQARGYDPVNARWIGIWFNLLSGLDPFQNPGGFMFLRQIALPAWLTLMGVETVVSYEPRPDAPGLAPVATFDFPPDPAVAGAGPSRVTVYRNTLFLGRAFAAPLASLGQDWQAAMAQSAQAAADPGASPTSAVVFDAGALWPGENIQSLNLGATFARQVDARWRVEETQAGPNIFRYRVDYPAPAFLCFAQSAYAGWQARIDGEPVRLGNYSGAFVAVELPAGQHEVEFKFVPRGLMAGRNITLLTALALLLLALRSRRRAS